MLQAMHFHDSGLFLPDIQPGWPIFLAPSQQLGALNKKAVSRAIMRRVYLPRVFSSRLCILQHGGASFFKPFSFWYPCAVCSCRCLLRETAAMVIDVMSLTPQGIRAKWWGLRSRLQSRRGWRQGWPKVRVAGLASLGLMGWGGGLKRSRMGWFGSVDSNRRQEVSENGDDGGRIVAFFLQGMGNRADSRLAAVSIVLDGCS